MDFSIHVDNVRKHYSLAHVEGKNAGGQILTRPGGAVDEKIAVDGISVDIVNGERLGIVGRNGAGKSTLLHMLAGLTQPTAGHISVRGKITAIMTLGIGLREQATGRENIYIDGEVQGKTRDEIDSVMDEIIDFAELNDFIDRPVRTYSTGMKSRLAFAMISCLEPEILIIDEALSAGDAHFANKATAKIRELCDRGKIVIIVSHSMNAIKTMCNRCLWIDQGRIVMDGSPEVVCSAYIDAVRGEDEAKLLERFKSEAGRELSSPGWSVDTLLLSQGNGATERVLVEAGENLNIHTRISASAYDRTTKVRQLITRLDGLSVVQFENTLTAPLKGNGIALKFEMNPLVLGPGVYRLEFSVWHQGLKQASRSVIFEVFTQSPPSGGRPLLLYPARVSARPVSVLNQ